MTDGVVIVLAACGGALIGYYVGRYRLLSQMHADDIEDAHKRYKGRKTRYLRRKGK